MILRSILLAGVAWAGSALAAPMATVDRNGSLVAIEPYAPNVVRVTIALDHGLSDAKPGYGIVAKSDAAGWNHTTSASGDTFSSSAVSLTVNAQPWPSAPSQAQHYFASSLPPVSIALNDASGQPIVSMTGWDMAPHDVAGEHTFRVSAGFSITPDEHFYGLGQNQEGTLDLRGRTIDCRHYYDAAAGEQVCVPVLVSSRNYMIVWDNPSATTVSPGMNNGTRIQSEVGERVSFFLITGNNSDDLYKGYRLLTGVTPLPPKAAFGLIQSKARYESQAELMGIAKGYRDRGYPIDVMVLDWFYWTRMGQIDIDHAYFP
ncbi:MAG: alpha-glucosidase, partial [Sphingomonas sp.]|nr:alpha-glucosidase [Sphingomonas sp.]